jgi:hypothetical protein
LKWFLCDLKLTNERIEQRTESIFMKNIFPRTKITVFTASTALWLGLVAARADGLQSCQLILACQTMEPLEPSASMAATVAELEADAQTQIDSDDPPAVAPVPAVPAAPAAPAVAAVPSADDIVIQSVEPDGKGKHRKEVAWLGLAVEESPEALSAQLGLKAGEGLTVTLLASGSPAAMADMRKNDVLVELDGQMLVDVHQFRKLVRMHAEGDSVKLIFYRGGKKQTASIKLAKINLESENDADMAPLPGDLQNLKFELKGLNGDMRGMSESLSRAGLDKAKLNAEVKRTMEQTRKAIQDAMRNASLDQRSLAMADQKLNMADRELKSIDRKSLAAVDRELESLARAGVDVDKDATVVVRSKHNSSRTIVETDDNGSYVIEAGAKTHLTARDKHGKLLFEGEIDTPAEQAKVPKEVWEKAKPMFEQIAAPSGSEPKAEEKPGVKPNSRNKMLAVVSYECA